jgi:uncharacterized GH25 family protein
LARIALTAALFLAAAAADAHDFWIEPSTFHPLPGTSVAVVLYVGQNFIGDEVPRYSGAIATFALRQAGSKEDIEGADNRSPAGFLRADGRSTAILSYASTGADIELPADTFEDYLRLYGLDRIVEERRERGEHAKPGRERFFRYAKALLTGKDTAPGVTQALGLAYEIVPDSDPTRAFAPLHGHVLYDGKPLAGALVVAILHSDPKVQVSMHTDAQGAFALTLPRGGVWLIKTVHMVRASYFSHNDWNSLWASLTFDMPEPRR